MTQLLDLDRTLRLLTSPRRWGVGLRRMILLTLPIAVLLWTAAMTAVCAVIFVRGMLRPLLGFWTGQTQQCDPGLSVTDLLLSPGGSVLSPRVAAVAATAQRRSDPSPRKPIRCRLSMHKAKPGHICNMGWDFGRCDSCQTELIRVFRGNWRTVPKGYRVARMSRAEWLNCSAPTKKIDMAAEAATWFSSRPETRERNLRAALGTSRSQVGWVAPSAAAA